MDLLSAIERNILSRRLLKCGQRVLVAVSGGLDSMVLLSGLQALSANHGWSLSVVHLNHRLRGRSSDADERLVRRTCASLKMPLTVRRRNVAAFAARKRLSIEMAAREVRHAFLAETALKARISTIALAHHADDQVELFFIRLFRGSGSEGLAGMRWRSVSPANSMITLVRPLLDQTKTELLQYAKEAGVRFREDASNASPNYLRNRVRNQLLPLLREGYQPALSRTVLRVMDIVAEEADFVSNAAKEWARHGPSRPFPIWPAALQRRWLQIQLVQASIPPEFDLIESLRCRPGRAVCVAPGQLALCTSDGRLHLQAEGKTATDFRPGSKRVDLSARNGALRFENVDISWTLERVHRFVKPHRVPGQEIFDADRVGTTVRLRHWRPGDRFQSIGMASAVKLQDLFTNEKVLRKRRHQLILGVTEQDQVFWVEGLRISERFKLTSASKRRLVWRWERP